MMARTRQQKEYNADSIEWLRGLEGAFAKVDIVINVHPRYKPEGVHYGKRTKNVAVQ